MTAELVCAATDPAWLDKRREGITATDIVTIAGLVTWDSSWALYHRKLGELPQVARTWRMERGRWIEPGLADQWDKHWLNADPIRPGGLYRNTARPWQMATPDYLVHAGSAVLECKSTQNREGWGPDGSDIMPRKVRVQVLWQMDTLGVAVGHVAADLAGEFRSYTIEHDEDHHGYRCQGCKVCVEIDGLRDLGFGFWSRILTRRPPDLDSLEITTDALRYLHPAPQDQKVIDSGYPLMWDGYAEAFANAKKNYDEMKNVIRDLMGDAHEATVDGRVVFRRTIGKRAGYTVAPAETDTLRRIGKDKD